MLCGISSRFQLLSPTERQVSHALLTRSPLSKTPKDLTPFDLHVLGTPPAFVLSQDQTLMFNPYPQLLDVRQALAKALSFSSSCQGV